MCAPSRGEKREDDVEREQQRSSEKEQQQNKHAFFPYMTSVVAVTMY
jgi:hypothetical protein